MSSDQIGKLFYVYLFYGNMIQFTNKSSDEKLTYFTFTFIYEKKREFTNMSSDQNGKLFYVYLFYVTMIQFTNKSSDEKLTYFTFINM